MANFCGGDDLFVGCIQFAKADVIRHCAGEQMGVLQHHAKAAAQITFADLAHINAVIGDGAGVDIIKAVDEVGNRGFARAGGTDKGDLLPRFGVQRNIMQGGLARNVTKADIPEPYIPAQGNERGGGVGTVAPGPQAGAAAAGAGNKGAVRRLFHTNDLDGTLIGFRLFVKHIENALGTGKGGQQKVALLGELVDGQSRLAHKHQIAGQAAQAGLAVHNHQPAQHGNDRIVDVGDGNNGGIMVAEYPWALVRRFAGGRQCLKTFQVGLLMVEHLDHLLPGGHLLHIAFQIAKSLLLAGVEETAAVGAEPDVQNMTAYPTTTSSESRQLSTNSEPACPPPG